MPNEIIDRLRAESNTEDNHMRLLLREAANTLEQMNAKNARLRERVKRSGRKNERLVGTIDNLRLKQFTRFAEDDCWIWQGDGSDSLETLVCPVVISASDLKAIIDQNNQLLTSQKLVAS
jgi:hypothetical protein